MKNVISINTEAFEARRKSTQSIQSALINLETVKNQEDALGVMAAISKFAGLKENENFIKEHAVPFMSKSAYEFTQTAVDAYKYKNYVVTKGANTADNDPQSTSPVAKVEKTFENFYGAMVSQSISVLDKFMTEGGLNGLSELRLSKAVSTEAQGLAANASVTLSSAVTTTGVIDTGYLELFNVTDELLGKSEGKILDLMGSVIVQRLFGTEEIKSSQPLMYNKLQTTEYEDYGICLEYGINEQQISAYFQTIGGVNGLFRAFRSKMAMNRSKQSYYKLTKMPANSAHIFEAEELQEAPTPSSGDGFLDRNFHKIARLAFNLQKASMKLIENCEAAGLEVGQLPEIHCLYHPSATGAMYINMLQDAMSRGIFFGGAALSANIVFHSTREQMASGAWVNEYNANNEKVLMPQTKFEKRVNAFYADAFGVMLVIPKFHNFFGLNSELRTVTESRPSTRSVAYYADERITIHVNDVQRMWVKNLIPVTEAISTTLATGE